MPPQSFGEYRLLRKLGDGAMGNVYLALDSLLDRQVAVKFIAASALDGAQRERFLIEARAAARLQHPNVVAVHRVGELAGRPYLVSEFVRGQSLDKLPKPISSRQALELGIGLVRGLAAAHRNGVLHRDIKPANAVLAADGQVKLIDFGLAKLFSDPLDLKREIDAAEPTEVRMAEDGDASDTLPLPQVLDEATQAKAEAFEWTPDPTAISPRPTSPRLSQPGRLMGTPYYLAPELWGGQGATVRSDIYAIGAVLYELVTGTPPNFIAKMDHSRGFLQLAMRVMSEPARPLAEVRPEVDAGFAAIVDRCLRIEPELRFASSDRLLQALLDLDAAAAPPLAVPEGNPYRGLRAFQAEHRALFFGRQREVRAVAERLRHESFVLVTGDSGVGKSSLCRAGVLPVLPSELDHPRRWVSAEMMPGRHPLLALASALAPFFGRDLLPTYQSIADALRQKHREGVGLVLFIDQLEELVSLSQPKEAAEFAEALSLLVTTPAVRLLGTIRSDFLTRVAGLPGLGDEVTRATHVLKPMSAQNIRDAIVGPAKAMGFHFESEDDVDALVTSTTGALGGLPLLQFALAELWDLRDVDRKSIPRGRLSAIGGVEGALARHADSVLERMLPEPRRAARRILTSLVTGEGTRARKSHGELVGEDPRGLEALDALVRGRLIVARALDGETAYELAHEALLRSWETLVGWLKNTAEARVARERIAQAAKEWSRLGDDDLLFSEKQLVELERLDLADIGETDRSFLARSKKRVRAKRAGRWASAAGAVVFAALIVVGVTLRARLDVDQRVRARLKNAEAMLAGAKLGRRQVELLDGHAFSRFDMGETADGEAVWRMSKERAQAVTASLTLARRELEAALAIDATRSDVRGLLVAAEMLRAEIAEGDFAQDTLDDALARLREWDATKQAVASWTSPVELTVATHPANAVVTVERYLERPNDHFALEPLGGLAETPGRLAGLMAGSYLLSFEAKGYAPVRYPIVLRRGQPQRIDLRLIETARVPSGFVYVPEGEFLVGSAADERLRTTLEKAVPLHRAWTNAFFISRHETTYAEWIAYLEAKGASSSGGPWPEGLRRVGPGVWELAIRPAEGGKQRFVRTGESVDLGDGAELDWSRWPVDRVLRAEVDGYLAWLKETGRVPGARLCRELEWERAARGADGRIYPHGNRLDPQDANFWLSAADARKQTRHEVGRHPASRSPFGVDDLAGNVWEIVEAVRRDPGQVVCRGGGFISDSAFLAVAHRELDADAVPLNMLGVRVCADVPPEGAR